MLLLLLLIFDCVTEWLLLIVCIYVFFMSVRVGRIKNNWFIECDIFP